ncbi:MAG: ribosomal protein S18-alanine N-acetyltransferase [Anaerolineae bacterium]|jgi:ribosomal-protein-alanine N-acetyltransferase|nr:ribosomal protein S18-alanine N-acetyltransferase [Anaerolineae bacterium]
MTVRVRPMQLGDVGQVTAIERTAFSSPWSPRTYIYEMTESDYSHMLSVTLPSAPLPAAPRWARLLLRWRPTPAEHLVAYGGLWHLYDEAHISTIASHPEHRGQGYGELALLAMMQRAVVLGAAYVALEVRVSNTRAQALYHKHGFQVAGVKLRYYHDNGENAYDMRLPLTDPIRQRVTEVYQAACQRMTVSDSYTGG